MRTIINDANETSKTMEEMEDALYHLMYQLRQINSKYGLMIGREIESIYDKNKDIISSSKGFVEEVDKYN